METNQTQHYITINSSVKLGARHTWSLIAKWDKESAKVKNQKKKKLQIRLNKQRTAPKLPVCKFNEEDCDAKMRNRPFKSDYSEPSIKYVEQEDQW